MQLKNYLTLFLSVAAIAFVTAQSTVSGVITDAETGETLIGANIILKGTLVGTVTDLDGKYELDLGDRMPPYKLVASYTGYQSKEQEVFESNATADFSLETQSVLGDEIVVSASRVEENILQSPVTIEKLDVQDIRLASSGDYFDEINKLKGVHSNQASMTFNSVNTRGFATAGNTRFVQLMDGMDNAAPLLNFPTGNVVGISELDIRSVELVPGAASALYGPNAFNGILLMESKSPFTYPGLSAQLKYGVTTADNDPNDHPYTSVGIRYAQPINDKLAFKIDFSALQATDWLANDYDNDRNLLADPNVTNTTSSIAERPNFDGLNSYGDETSFLLPFSQLNANPALRAGVIGAVTQATGGQLPASLIGQYYDGNINNIDPILLTRTGVNEETLLDNRDAESFKASAALHYKVADNVEAIYNYRYGSGSSVYQGSERYALRDFVQQFHKVEVRGTNYFVRGYVSQTDASDSYNMTALGAFTNERISPTQTSWAPDYAAAYLATLVGAGLAPLAGGGTPVNIADFTPAQLQAARASAHSNARAFADRTRTALTSDALQDIIDGVRNDKFQDPNGGAGFTDNSRLWHGEFNYDFAPLLEDIGLQVGANFRQYDLFTNGTIFNEDPDGDGVNERIKINEYGAYVQISKLLMDERLRLSASVRYDKNENFDGQVSPRASVVYSMGERKQHNIRASFQTGFRNPTTQAQFIFFPTTNTIIGGTEENAAQYGLYNGGAWTKASYDQFRGALAAGTPADQAQALLVTADVDFVKPEQLTAFELGYKGLMSKKFFLDVHGYYNIYNDFIGQALVQNKNVVNHEGSQYAGNTPLDSRPFLLYTNINEQITSWGAALGLTYRITRNFEVFANYSWADFDQEDSNSDLNAGFNTPNNRYTVGITGKDLLTRVGFNLSYRWQEEFYYFSSFGEGMVDEFGVFDAQVSFKVPEINSVIKVGANNLFGDDFRTNIGNPFIGQLYYVSITYDEFMSK